MKSPLQTAAPLESQQSFRDDGRFACDQYTAPLMVGRGGSPHEIGLIDTWAGGQLVNWRNRLAE